MVKQDALMESLSSNLHGFLNPIQRGLSVPGKKFLWDGFLGLVRAGQHLFLHQEGLAVKTLIKKSGSLRFLNSFGRSGLATKEHITHFNTGCYMQFRIAKASVAESRLYIFSH